MRDNDTIVAISTPHGTGGVAIVRISGPEAISICDSAWRGRPLKDVETHTVHLGHIMGEDGNVLDQGVATVYRAPRSYTGEDVVELGVHGSEWVQREVVMRLVELGARPASPGEFTQRAFLNRRIDLAQAEGVADLLAAKSRAAHTLAMTQMQGGFSKKLDQLRSELTNLASLMELELDFSEEDVEFADRSLLLNTCNHAIEEIERLCDTYASGKTFKEGIAVVIAGKPNAGKSTLLNALLGNEKAIVSDIAGTTRDIIEDTVEIDGILFRFYDTAGLHDSDNTVEQIGITRAQEKISQANIIIWTVDAADKGLDSLDELRSRIKELPDAKHIIALNKTDLCGDERLTDNISKLSDSNETDTIPLLGISAKDGDGMTQLRDTLSRIARSRHNPDAELILTNARHYDALRRGAQSLRNVTAGLQTDIPIDLISQDMRIALHHIGSVTGAITTPDLLQNIFSRFCIGK